MKIRKNQCIILAIDDKVIAISENIDDIYRYINQFSDYFQNNKEYKILFQNIANNTFMTMYWDYYLQPLNSKIILTDKEIYHYSPMFREMYENTKTMMSQCIINNSIMNLTSEEKKLNNQMVKMMHEKVYSYQSFLESLDTDTILKKYIINPLLVKEIDL